MRSRFLARPPLVVTDQNAALSSGTILANSVLETDAEDGRIQNNLNVVLGSVQSTAGEGQLGTLFSPPSTVSRNGWGGGGRGGRARKLNC